mmetsp:Transcript_15044/g.38482  ORF Transcript_15044/g.38482 Transcript_15044/m.38482 type:complete len:284 (+) Transcript_15044:430-1281(+)
MGVQVEQDGHTKPDMFSTTPRIGVPDFLQKLISLRTSTRETSWGVVTMTAPSMLQVFKNCTKEMCSSLVPGGESMTKKSMSPQSTSFKNCLISPVFLGPLQITASSRLGSINATLITPRFSFTYTGCHPAPDCVTVCPSRPSMVGAEGPQMSTSRRPTSGRERSSSRSAEEVPGAGAVRGEEREKASWAARVDLPTPPLPDRTRILCLMFLPIRCSMRAMSGSTGGASPFARAVEESEQAAWLGQPAQAEDCPAASLSVPGHAGGAVGGTVRDALGSAVVRSG